MDKITFINYETKICADWLNTVSDTVWDALGQAKDPASARLFIGAQPLAPDVDPAGPWVGAGGSWANLTLDGIPAGSFVHNNLAGRDEVDCHPVSSITGLQAALDLKADITYVDQQNAAQDADHIGLIIALG